MCLCEWVNEAKKCIECSGRVEKWCITTSTKYSGEQGDNPVRTFLAHMQIPRGGPSSSYEDS